MLKQPGFSETIPCASLNRLGASGLETVATLAAKIKAGMIDIGVGGGVEKLSFSYNPNLINSSIYRDRIV